MSSPLISVIMPAYNVAPFIKRSIESVLTQSYRNIEVILIDDGSTDNTGRICDDYASKDIRIKVIHQNNGGLSDARNKGIEASSGEWIHFLDSDDWIEPQMYEVLLNNAIDNDAEMSSCLSQNCYEDGSVDRRESNGSIEFFSSDDLIRGLLSQNKVRFEVWNKLWKRSLIGDVRFKERQVCEDVRFNRLIFPRVNKCVHVNLVLHNYLKARKGSTIDGFKIGKMCVFDEFDEWRSSLKLNKPELEEIITCIENTFAQRLYIMAVNTDQDKEVLSTLKRIYNRTYTSIKGSDYIAKFPKLLFRFSPSLFIVMLHAKKKNRV